MVPPMTVTCPRCQRELPEATGVCPHDGAEVGARPSSVKVRPSLFAAAALGEELPVGTKLGDYVVGSVIGSGGMGDVYAGEQPVIGKKVAIKLLKLSASADLQLESRMLDEARAVNAIRHRNIVDIFTVGKLPDGRTYLVMEWLDGEPLDRLVARGPLPPLEVVEILEEVCSALAAAHAKGIVHRDLKPANIFVSPPDVKRGRFVKLLDFGLAKSVAPTAERRTRVGVVLGTPDYIAPEQATGKGAIPSSDLYALGVTAFELLTGTVPFSAPNVPELMLMQVNDEPPAPSSVLDSVPPELDELVLWLMEKEPEDRPASADAVLRQLGAIKKQLRQGSTTVRPMEVQARPARQSRPAPAPLPRPEAPTPLESPPVAQEAAPAPRGRSLGTALAVGTAAVLGLAALAYVRFGQPEEPVHPPEPPRPITGMKAVTPPPEPVPTPAPEPVKRAEAPAHATTRKVIEVNSPGATKQRVDAIRRRLVGAYIGRPDAYQEFQRLNSLLGSVTTNEQLDGVEKEVDAFSGGKKEPR